MKSRWSKLGSIVTVGMLLAGCRPVVATPEPAAAATATVAVGTDSRTDRRNGCGSRDGSRRSGGAGQGRGHGDDSGGELCRRPRRV